jgi:hypothetical protein
VKAMSVLLRRTQQENRRGTIWFNRDSSIQKARTRSRLD